MQRNLEDDKETTKRLSVKSLSSLSGLRRSRSSSSGASSDRQSAWSGASSDRKVSTDRKIRTQSWTKHLEDGVFHAVTPLSEKLPKDVQTLLSSKGALQCMEKFIMDLKTVPKHGTFKKGYNVEKIKPIAGEYAGKLEKLGISMFFCSFTDAKRMLHQWFEFVDREINSTYMPRERVDLPRAVFLKMTLDEEVTEQEGLGRCSISTSASSNAKVADMPTESTISSLNLQSDVITSVASTDFQPSEHDEGAGNDHIHVEECTGKVIDAHTQPPQTFFHKLTLGCGFGTPCSTADFFFPGGRCVAATGVSVHTIAFQNDVVEVIDSGTVVNL